MTHDNDDTDERDTRKIVLYDDEALKLMQGWTGGQSDPLYAISSTGGWNYAWVFSDAIANIDRDLSRVKKLGRNKYQLGRGTFSEKDIDELRYIRDALQMTLDDPESVMVDEGHRGVVRTPRHYPEPGRSPRHFVSPGERGRRVADFNTLNDLLEHARGEGATHYLQIDDETHIYFQRRDGRYEKAEAWQKDGYWHTQAPGSRAVVSKPPSSARPIVGSATRLVRDYEAIDSRDRVIAGPFKSYGDAKTEADRARGVVRFVPSKGHRAPPRASEARETRSAHNPRPGRRSTRRR